MWTSGSSVRKRFSFSMLLVAIAAISLVWAVGVVQTREPHVDGKSHRTKYMLRVPNASEPPSIESGNDAASIFQQIDKSFSQFATGSAAFAVPDEMKVGETRRVVARIGRTGEAADILNGLQPDLARHLWREGHITPTMGATLVGNGFEIRPDGEQIQAIGGGSYTEWQWLVTAQPPSGKKELDLHITAYLHVYGLEKPRLVYSESKVVAVNVNPRLLITNAIELNLQNGITAGIASVFTLLATLAGRWAWRRIRRCWRRTRPRRSRAD